MDDTDVETQGRIAAFFDLDKTIIAGSSLLIFCPDLYKIGYINRSTLFKAKIANVIYMSRLGANRSRSDKFRDDALKITKGWDSDEVLDMVNDVFDEVVDPTVYKEAVDLIEDHKAKGHLVIVVSSSPMELVRPITYRLGVDKVIASVIGRDENGKLDGKLELYVHGPFKEEEVKKIAEELNIDLEKSFAYSDSITDTHFLECVGNPVAINPDIHLTKYAKANGWEIRDFRKKITLKERLPVNSLRNPWVQAAAGVGVTVGAGLYAARQLGRRD